LPQPKYPLGSIVRVFIDMGKHVSGNEPVKIDLKGWCELFIVGTSELDGKPRYTVSDIPVRFEYDDEPFDQDRVMYLMLSTLVEHVDEDEIQPIEGDPSKPLFDSIHAWASWSADHVPATA
jgi:hypothetical protein